MLNYQTVLVERKLRASSCFCPIFIDNIVPANTGLEYINVYIFFYCLKTGYANLKLKLMLLMSVKQARFSNFNEMSFHGIITFLIIST